MLLYSINSINSLDTNLNNIQFYDKLLDLFILCHLCNISIFVNKTKGKRQLFFQKYKILKNK